MTLGKEAISIDILAEALKFVASSELKYLCSRVVLIHENLKL